MLQFIERKVIFCCVLFWSVGAVAQMVVNKPVANMYSKPDANSSVVSQAIYNSKVTILKQAGKFVYIKTPIDHYSGWMKRANLTASKATPRKHVVEVANLFAKIYQINDTIPRKPVLTVPFSTRLPLVKQVSERWLKVQLPDGTIRWIQRPDVTIDPKPLSMQQMLVLSRKFLGLPYEWGGVSTYGIDCSAYVQLMYRQMGISIPRDGSQQAKSPLLMSVAKKDLQPGDLLYFGRKGKISHAGLYLGDGEFISITTYKDPVVQIGNLSLAYWQKLYMTARRLKGSYGAPKFVAKVSTIPTKVATEIKKYTWRKDCPVPVDNLSYVQLTYWGFDDRAHQGALIVNNHLAQEVVGIFRELYGIKFAIAKMRPMYLYKGDDQAAMRDNDTSAFNCRHQTDFPKLYSVHSYGGAIDINPLINPYVNDGKVLPKAGEKYLDRSKYHRGKITANSDAVQIFTKYNWLWGGDWTGSIRDYQHFEKPMKK